MKLIVKIPFCRVPGSNGSIQSTMPKKAIKQAIAASHRKAESTSSQLKSQIKTKGKTTEIKCSSRPDKCNDDMDFYKEQFSRNTATIKPLSSRSESPT